jgi:prolyl-tRNA synthetase
MLDVYATFAHDYMAMPVIRGEKTTGEKFPGAVDTYTIEAMMQDRKALQAGTSHFLGQNFAKAQEIKYLSAEGREEFCWTTSWGVTTRLVGALVMTHSDDDGLVLPPRLAPAHVVIMPIFRTDEERATVLDFCSRLERELKSQVYDGEPVRVLLDARDMRGGEKSWLHVKRGVPVRLEIGPRDVASGAVFMARRDRAANEKSGVPRDEFVANIGKLLAEIQDTLLARARALRDENTRTIDNREEFIRYFTPKNEEKPEIHGGFALCHYAEDPAVAQLLGDLKVSIRCLPLAGQIAGGERAPGKCIFTGKPSPGRAVLAKAY